MDHNPPTRTRRIAESVFIFLPGLLLGAFAILKIVRVPGVVQQMTKMGFADGKLMLVALLELLSSVLFLLPRTRSLGLVFLSAFFGGVICTHVQFGEYAKAGAPSVLLFLAWLGIWLRHPSALWSFHAHSSATSQLAENKRERLVSHKV